MSKTFNTFTAAAALVGASLSFAPVANAVTFPNPIADFTATPSQVLQVRPKSWMDPAFGDMGWTHHSAWGSFHAEAGQKVTIKAVAANDALHPGVSVWYRGAKDTAPDKYVLDHFYGQDASQYKRGAVDETTQQPIGDIVMKIVAFGYDLDGQARQGEGLRGKRDGVRGQLELSFTAKNAGEYMFVLGGVNPGKMLTDFSVKYDVQTDVTVETPAAP